MPQDLNLILKEGEVICSKCHGAGQVLIVIRDNEYSYNDKCNKCYGEGKTDWVTNIMWVEPVVNEPLLSSSMSSSSSSSSFYVK